MKIYFLFFVHKLSIRYYVILVLPGGCRQGCLHFFYKDAYVKCKFSEPLFFLNFQELPKRGLRPPVSLLLHSRKFTLQAKLKNVKPHHRDSNQGPSACRADALTTAPWCCSHSQRRKHDIFLLACTYLQPHTTQVGLRPQTIVGSATFLVKLPSRRTLDLKKLL